MQPLDRFEQLARVARADRAPAVDIAGAVLGKLSVRSPRRYETASMVLFAALAAIAASIAVGVAAEAWEAIADPLAGLYPLLTLVIQ